MELELLEPGDANHSPQFNPSKISLPRMITCMIGLWLCLFLSALETTIVATALDTISSDLDSLGESSWIIVAYLLTYNGFLLLFSKLTDILGQKSLLVLAQLLFLVFSMACGAAQTMTQLVVFRALQGIGGSGIYSTVFVIITKIITADKIGLYTGILTSVFAVASLLGPILGGIIVDHTTWRWVFFLNGPGIVISLGLIIPGIPGIDENILDKENLRRVDAIGGILSLVWPTLLVFAWEEGGESYAWNSRTIIGTLVGGAVSLFAFVFYERWVVQHRIKTEPVLPMRLLNSPRLCLNLLTMFCVGVCFYGPIVLLPQRFQNVDGLSPMNAGIKLLPFTIASPAFSVVCGFVLGKFQRSVAYLIGIGATLIVIGIALLGSLPTSKETVATASYAYELLLAAGTGFIMPPLVFMLKVEFNDADLASAMGTNNTSRTLGGCVGLAVASAVLHSQMRNTLSTFLSSSQVATVLGSLTSSSSSSSDLSPSDLVRIRHAYALSYNAQFRALLAFSCVGMVSGVALGVLKERQMRRRLDPLQRGLSSI